jgi:hypothetical protein
VKGPILPLFDFKAHKYTLPQPPPPPPPLPPLPSTAAATTSTSITAPPPSPPHLHPSLTGTFPCHPPPHVSLAQYYYDTDTKDLYWFYNSTGAPPTDLEIAGTSLQQLITIEGAGSARGETGPHVTDITIRGVQFSDAALSYLYPHGLPSDGGGDWALARRAAVHIIGAERVTVDSCLFERIDGNGVMLSGYVAPPRFSRVLILQCTFVPVFCFSDN